MNKHQARDFLKDGNIRELLVQDLLDSLDKDDKTTPGQAFLSVCVKYLGLDTDIGIFTDGAGDGGIDFIEVGDESTSIVQSKSVEFEDRIDFDQTIGVSHIGDLARIRKLIETLDDIPTELNSLITSQLRDLRHILRSSTTPKDPYYITVHFCAQGSGFTPQAQEEFNKFDTTPIKLGDATVKITYQPIFLPDLLEMKWNETNTKWRTKKNEKKVQFNLDVCGKVINEPKSVVFFTRASQLVNIFNEIGYQLFDNNVRCEIRNSSVNKAIMQSALSHRGRIEFKHLNNGITIVCDGFSFIGPKGEPNGVRLNKPGVINGLQTVRTLANAVKVMAESDLIHFNKVCQVLVRVHTSNAVQDPKDMVKSTNNQNPMKPRNLRSNDQEQIALEKYFAEKLGWFYERKEGAWEAFSSDHRRWSTISKPPQDFISGKIKKRVDNELIAQSWLAFIGFSEQAVDQKRYLFSTDKTFYDLIFRHQTVQHGAKFNHSMKDAIEKESLQKTPTGEGLLIAYLAGQFAKRVIPSRKDNRIIAVKRLKLESKARAEQDLILEEDSQYQLGLMLRSMIFLFTEFFGYLMYASFNTGIHLKFSSLLRNRSLAKLHKTGDFEAVKQDYESKLIAKDDILLTTWELYQRCVEQMIYGKTWLAARRAAPNVSKFMYSSQTRDPLYKELHAANEFIAGPGLSRLWAVGMNESKGIEQYIRSTLS